MFPLLLALAGCLHLATPPPPISTVEPVSFELLEGRISALLPVVSDADQRDRLLALRGMVEGMRGQEPAAQHVVYMYVERVLLVEERVQPVAIDAMEGPAVVPIAVESVDIPASNPDLDGARIAFAAGDFSKALSLLDAVPVSDPRAAEAMKLRQEVVDGWARVERESAGEAFLKAKALAAGPERATALTAVRDALLAINNRHPGNAYAEAIRENIARVDAELAAP